MFKIFPYFCILQMHIVSMSYLYTTIYIIILFVQQKGSENGV